MSEELQPKNESGNKEGEPSESPIPEEILNAIPEKDRPGFIRTITQFSGVFPQQNPLLRKITTEHISQIIQNANNEDIRDREERGKERNYNYKLFVTAIIAILLISGLFIWAKETEFLKYIIGAIIGFAGGFGVGKYYNKQG